MKNHEQFVPELTPANHLEINDEQLRDIEGHPDLQDLAGLDSDIKSGQAQPDDQELTPPEGVNIEESAPQKEMSYAEKLSDPVYMRSKREAEKAKENLKDAKNYGQIEQIEYATGAKHIYGIDQDGKKRHLSNVGVLESYGYKSREEEEAILATQKAEVVAQEEVAVLPALDHEDDIDSEMSDEEFHSLREELARRVEMWRERKNSIANESHDSGLESDALDEDIAPEGLDQNPLDQVSEDDLSPKGLKSRLKRMILKASMFAKKVGDMAIIPAWDAAQQIGSRGKEYYRDEEKGKKRLIVSAVAGGVALAATVAAYKYGAELLGDDGRTLAAPDIMAGDEMREPGLITETASEFTEQIDAFNNPVKHNEGISHLSERIGIFFDSREQWDIYNPEASDILRGLPGTYEGKDGLVYLIEGAEISPSAEQIERLLALQEKIKGL